MNASLKPIFSYDSYCRIWQVPAPAKSLKKFVALSDCGSSVRCICSKEHLVFAPSGQATVLADSQSQFLEILLLGANYIHHSAIDLFCEQLIIWFYCHRARLRHSTWRAELGTEVRHKHCYLLPPDYTACYFPLQSHFKFYSQCSPTVRQVFE